MDGEAVRPGAEDHPPQRNGLPGTLALKLCPDSLKYVGRPKTIIAVTGTNGKTTVSNLLADTLEKEGHRVLINRAGSNVASGIATALLKGCNLAGRVKRLR